VFHFSWFDYAHVCAGRSAWRVPFVYGTAANVARTILQRSVTQVRYAFDREFSNATNPSDGARSLPSNHVLIAYYANTIYIRTKGKYFERLIHYRNRINFARSERERVAKYNNGVFETFVRTDTRAAGLDVHVYARVRLFVFVAYGTGRSFWAILKGRNDDDNIQRKGTTW